MQQLKEPCMPQRLIILQSADIHGEIDGVARIATLVERVRNENPHTPVLYIDGGDSQDRDNWFSSHSSGTGMYRLLSAAGCQVSVMSNKNIKKYGVEILRQYAEASNFPILVSNLFLPNGKPIPGTAPTTILKAGDLRIGVIGVTAPGPKYVAFHHLTVAPAEPQIRLHLEALQKQGVDAIIILSHMGLYDDYQLAETFQGEIPLIIGGHSHALRRGGAWVGNVAISHIGAYGHYLGRIDLTWNGYRLSVDQISLLTVSDDIPLHPACTAIIESATTGTG
jgi:2',3'-cyclic-nucleotide 2'-phosphodiesterase (5'-nucleotidase family)